MLTSSEKISGWVNGCFYGVLQGDSRRLLWACIFTSVQIEDSRINSTGLPIGRFQGGFKKQQRHIVIQTQVKTVQDRSGQARTGKDRSGLDKTRPQARLVSTTDQTILDHRPHQTRLQARQDHTTRPDHRPKQTIKNVNVLKNI